MLEGLFTLRFFAVAFFVLFAIYLLKSLEQIYEALQGIPSELHNLGYSLRPLCNPGDEHPIDRILRSEDSD